MSRKGAKAQRRKGGKEERRKGGEESRSEEWRKGEEEKREGKVPRRLDSESSASVSASVSASALIVTHNSAAGQGHDGSSPLAAKTSKVIPGLPPGEGCHGELLAGGTPAPGSAGVPPASSALHEANPFFFPMELQRFWLQAGRLHPAHFTRPTPSFSRWSSNGSGCGLPITHTSRAEHLLSVSSGRCVGNVQGPDFERVHRSSSKLTSKSPGGRRPFWVKGGIADIPVVRITRPWPQRLT
jgi:hypothetical protein